MQTINANKTGLAFGVLLGGWHLVWVLLVLVGWAQPMLDFIFWLHLIKPVYTIEPFALGRAVGLVVLTAVVGYVGGWLFGLVWNRLHR
jgi:hypothetical protein